MFSFKKKKKKLNTIVIHDDIFQIRHITIDFNYFSIVENNTHTHSYSRSIARNQI